MDFGLPMRPIEGPTFVEAKSLMTGPRAKLVGYSDTLFRGETRPASTRSRFVRAS